MEEEINAANAAVVNTDVACGTLSVSMIECLFYGIIKCEYQICKSLDDKYVFVFSDGKDALKFKMSKLEEKMQELKSSSGSIGSVQYPPNMRTNITWTDYNDYINGKWGSSI